MAINLQNHGSGSHLKIENYSTRQDTFCRQLQLKMMKLAEKEKKKDLLVKK